MIEYVTGNIFDSEADALVNAVNCEGYMGKGIAFQFKNRYPLNNIEYIDACNSGKLKVGQIHYHKENGKIILNFPTKNKWRQKSKLEYIEKGMDQLVELLPKLNIKSVAIPPLGCGNGGLKWEDVEKIIKEKLNKIENDYDFYIYAPINHKKSGSKSIPKLSLQHLILMRIKIRLGKNFSEIRLQNAAFILNILLDNEYFKFEKHNGIPYSNAIKDLGIKIKEFQAYYKENTQSAYDIALQILMSKKIDAKLALYNDAIEKAINIVGKIDCDMNLKAVITVIYQLLDSVSSIDELYTDIFKNMMDIKTKFVKSDIQFAVKFLEENGLIEKHKFLGYKIIPFKELRI